MSQSNGGVSITFQIFQGEELVRTETLTQDIIKIGKLSSSHLRIEDDNVSRMHAVIEVTSPDEIYVIDLGSAAGTIVNGKKVNKARLQHGDEIVLGGARVVVSLGAATDDDEDELTTVGARAEVAAAVATAAAREAEPVANPFAASANYADGEMASPFAPVATGGAMPNPFAAPVEDPHESAYADDAHEHAFASHGHGGGHGHDEDEDSENTLYGIAASGPPVNASEIESGASSVEVVLMWGDRSILHVAHLSPPRTFTIGEKSAGMVPDYLIGSEVIGTERLALVSEVGGNTAVVIPQGADGEVTIGDQEMTWAEAQATGKLSPSSEMAGAMQYVLPAGATARVEYQGITWVVRPTVAARPIGMTGPPTVDWSKEIWTGVSLFVHAALLMMFYFMPPSSSMLSLDLYGDEARRIAYLLEADETVEEETPEWLEEVDQNDDQEGGTGKRHDGEEGAMGEESAQKTTNRYGIEGPADNPDPHMARQAAREQAATVGAIGVLQAAMGAWNSPTSPYGQDTASGTDPMSALGALMGDQIGSNFGYGGLGLRGTGRGGGGTGQGTIGLGNLGTIGHGSGTGSGSGYGSGAGGFRGRSSSVPRIRTAAADVRGSLSREVIRRVVRRHINEVRFCYEQELNSRPDLSGRVTVSFIVSATGAVQTASVAQSTLHNSRVESCIAQAVRRWTFPAPDGGGIVGVNYPFVLDSQG